MGFFYVIAMSIIKKLKDFKKSFVSSHGKNNHVFVIDPDGKCIEVRRLSNCHIKFKGDNNTVKIYKPFGDLNLDIEVCNNTNIVLKPSVLPRGIKIVGFDNNHNNIVIGKNFLTSATISIMLLRGCGDITIGDDSMMGWGSEIRLGDGHNILDKTSGEIINSNQNINIGNHVWIASDVLILKGADIPDNSIVGVKSVVTKPFTTKNVVIAGIPAKVVKTNVDWTHKSQYQ